MTEPNALAIRNAHPRDKHVQFDEGPHVYTVRGNSKNVSVTTLVHHCFPLFDSKKIVEGIMKGSKINDPTYKYYGMTLEQIEAEWKQNGEKAASMGTQMHYDIECYYNGLPVENTSVEFQYFMKFTKDYPELEAYRTEWVVFYEDIRLAGSIDMVFYNRETGFYEIYDWKRVLDIQFDSFKKTDVGIPEFLQETPNTNFWHYTLQLNIYKKILQDKYGLTIHRMYLIVLHPDNEYKSYQRLEVPDFQDKVDALFDMRRQQLVLENSPTVVADV